MCSRNGARTWAGRQSEPHLGGGKTSVDEAAGNFTSDSFHVDHRPHPADRPHRHWIIWLSGDWGRRTRRACLHPHSVHLEPSYRDTYEHARVGNIALFGDMDPWESHATTFAHHSDTLLSNHNACPCTAFCKCDQAPCGRLLCVRWFMRCQGPWARCCRYSRYRPDCRIHAHQPGHQHKN